MSTPLIDRNEEVARLRELAVSGSPKLALMTGPRRVGKTFLLNNVWLPQEYFLFTASRTSPALNRKQTVLRRLPLRRRRAGRFGRRGSSDHLRLPVA